MLTSWAILSCSRRSPPPTHTHTHTVRHSFERSRVLHPSTIFTFVWSGQSRLDQSQHCIALSSW